MKFECSHCQQKIEAADEWIGHLVECPACGQSIMVPKAANIPVQAVRAEPRQQLPPRPPQSRLQPRASYRGGEGGGGGGGKFWLFVLLLIAVAFVAATYYCNGSPQEVLRRLSHYIENLIHPPPAPAPTPAPTPTPSPTPIPTPTPTPTPMPSATPTPSAPDPMTWLLEHKESQPREVALLEPVDFPVVFNGRVVGSAKLPAGSIVELVSIEGDTLIASNNGAANRVPVKATDLLQRVLIEMAKPPPTPAPALAVAATPAPTAKPTPFNGFEDTTAGGEPKKEGAFVHPGLLHTNADFHRMKTHIGREPWKSGWEKLIANRHSSAGWKPQAVAVVVRGNGDQPQNYGKLYNDIAAAYACALRWRISSDVVYANTAVEILNAWSSTLKEVSGSADRFLAAGIYGYEFANAAEIMRTYHGWKPEDFARFQKMMLTVFYPINHSFLERHNGAKPDHYWANWDGCNMASVIAIGVLCDKRSIYEEGIRYFKHGDGNASIGHAVVCIHNGGLGQWQESGRDQGHTMMGMGLYGAICQMAFNQGDDLFAYDNNRFLAGAEYVAKYNSGEDVPFTPYANSSFKSEVVSPASRGNDRPVWDLIYNHYVKLKGISAPYVAKMAEKSRPEGGGGDYGPNSGGFDQLGYGTLTCTLDPAELEAAPAASP